MIKNLLLVVCESGGTIDKIGMRREYNDSRNFGKLENI